MRLRRSLRVGVCVPRTCAGLDPVAVRSLAAAAEQLGYGSLWAGPGGADPSEAALVDLCHAAFAASSTHRVPVGLGVVVDGSLPPSALRRALAALAALAERRVVVAVRPGGRAGAEALEQLLQGQDDPGAARPAIPGMLVDGDGDLAVGLAASRVAGWCTSELDPHRLRSAWDAVRAAAGERGRDPAELRLVVRADLVITPGVRRGDRRPGRGSLEEVVGDLVDVAGAGADEIVLALPGEVRLDEALSTYAAVAEALEDLRR